MNVPSEERERVESILLGVRALVHGVNHRVARAILILDLMQKHPDLPREFCDLAQDALAELNESTEHLRSFGQAVQQVLQGSDGSDKPPQGQTDTKSAGV